MRKIRTNVVAALVSAAMFFASSCSKDTAILNPAFDKSMTEKTAARIAGPSANGPSANGPSANGPSANGQGAVFLDYPGSGLTPGVQHFSFHANTDRNGNVTGSFETKYADNGRIHGTIDCLSILADGKTAIMSGTVTQVSGATFIAFGFAVGDDAWFKVQDNGEGTNATEDSFSDIYAYFDLEPCTFDYVPDAYLFTILNGNIQVKP